MAMSTLGQLLITALELAANTIIITDREGIILWVNPAFTHLTGYTPEEIVGQTPRLLKSGQHDQAFYQYLWETILAGQVWHGEITNRRKDGSLYTEEMTITPVLDERGAISHFTAIKQDVTARKRAEEALERSEAHFRSLIENAADIITVLDADGTIRYGSPSIERVLGYPLREILGRSVFEFLHPDDVPQARRVFTETLQQPGVTHVVETRVRHHDGSWRVFEALGKSLLGEAGVVEVVINARDMTERKRAEAEAERRRQEVETFATLMGDLASSLELDQVLGRLVIKAKDLSQGDFASLALVKADGETLTIRAQTGAVSPFWQGLTMRHSQGMAGWVLETGVSFVIDDYLQDHRLTHTAKGNAAARAEGTVAQVGIPILHEGTPLGVLLVARRTPRPFTTDDLHLLQEEPNPLPGGG